MSEQFPEKKNLKQIQIIRFHFSHLKLANIKPFENRYRKV